MAVDNTNFSDSYEVDSAYGGSEVDSEYDNSAIYTFELVSIDSSDSLSCEENGRTYHSHGCTEYWGPNDEPAREQQDVSHEFFRQVLGGELFIAPIGKSPQDILDIGTGTGIWAIEAAEIYPSSQVVGIDLSKMQPTRVPPNVEFQIDDINSGRYKEDREYDLIHVRELLGSVVDWPELIGKCFDALKPGGWIDLAEPSICFIPTRAFNEIHPFSQWADMFITAGQKNGMGFDIGSKLEGWLKGAGFVDVVVKKITVPIGGKTPLGKWNLVRLQLGVFDFSARLLCRVLGWDRWEIEIFLASIRRELNRSRADVSHMQEFYFVCGQKPLEA